MNSIKKGRTVELEDHTVTGLGTVKIGPSNYGIEEVHYFGKNGAVTHWLQLRGPRGTAYQLQEDMHSTGKYTPISLGSGPMIRKGNPVKIIILGDIIQAV